MLTHIAQADLQPEKYLLEQSSSLGLKINTILKQQIHKPCCGKICTTYIPFGEDTDQGGAKQNFTTKQRLTS
jgi:hypothetical protein